MSKFLKIKTMKVIKQTDTKKGLPIVILYQGIRKKKLAKFQAPAICTYPEQAVKDEVKESV